MSVALAIHLPLCLASLTGQLKGPLFLTSLLSKIIFVKGIIDTESVTLVPLPRKGTLGNPLCQGAIGQGVEQKTTHLPYR